MKRYLFIVLAGCCLAAGCRKIELVNPTEYEVLPFGENPDADPIGMYLLNEGNMGSNKADIDYLDYRTAVYARGIYAEKNPNVVKELGDVGNDIQVYDGRLFAVINCSHKVEVMDAYTARRITQIDIPNCRYIRFKGKYAYVSAYVGPVAMDPDAQKGAVFKVDLDTYRIVGQVTVGYQPDELAIVGDRAYVANSAATAPRTTTRQSRSSNWKPCAKCTRSTWRSTSAASKPTPTAICGSPRGATTTTFRRTSTGWNPTADATRWPRR